MITSTDLIRNHILQIIYNYRGKPVTDSLLDKIERETIIYLQGISKICKVCFLFSYPSCAIDVVVQESTENKSEVAWVSSL